MPSFPVAGQGVLELYLRRLRFFSSMVAEAQTLAGSSGSDGRPWAAAFQEFSVSVYAMTLPESYVLRLGQSFLACVDVLDQLEPVLAEAGDSLEIARSYFSHGARAIAQQAEVPLTASLDDRRDPRPTTPGIVRFDLLAERASVEGVARQQAAAEDMLDRLVSRSLPIDDTERQWVSSISQGLSVAEIAAHAGLSERSMYRRMNDTWTKLGVSNSKQAIALMAENGWL